jgi:hypothetical protein
MCTVSTSWPSPKRSSHFRVPSYRLLRDGDGRPLDHELLGEAGAEILGQRGHGREVGGATMIDPMPELAGAELRRPDGGHRGGQRLAIEADQVCAAPVWERLRAPPAARGRRAHGERDSVVTYIVGGRR